MKNLKKIEIDSLEERNIIINMITNTKFLRGVYDVINKKYFSTQYSKTVVSWVLEYYEAYKESPGKEIQNIYLKKMDQISEDIAGFISDMLENLSLQHSINNVDYSIDNTIRFFKKRSLELLSSNISKAVAKGDLQQAEESISNYKTVDRIKIHHVDMLNDVDKIIESTINEDNFLYRFPGALGEIVGDFERETVDCIQAFTGRGKTWIMKLVSVCALYAGLNVVEYNFEMPEKHSVNRSWRGLTQYAKYDKITEYPYFIHDQGTNKYTIDWRKEEAKKIDISKIEEDQNRIKLDVRGGGYIIRTMPTYSMSMVDIDNDLANLEYYEDYVADVVILDYIGIMKHLEKGELRHKLNDSWKRAKGLAQKRKLHIFSGHQGTIASATSDTNEGTMSESKLSTAHMNKLIGVNSTRKEMSQGIFRIGISKQREEECLIDQAIVLSNLDIGMPYIDSKMSGEVIL